MLLINQALAFIIEIIAIFIYGYFGYNIINLRVIRIILAIVMPLIVMTIWGIYLAPKSLSRLEMPMLFAAKLIIMGIACVMLIYLNKSKEAIMFGIFVAIHFMISFLLNDF